MERNVIIYNDDDTSMKKIEVNGKMVSEGNYWDFDLDQTLKTIAQELKFNVRIKGYKYE